MVSGRLDLARTNNHLVVAKFSFSIFNRTAVVVFVFLLKYFHKYSSGKNTIADRVHASYLGPPSSS